MAQKQFIIDGGFTTNADSSLTGNLDMTGHIIPTVDSDGVTGYDLGSPDMKWRDLYLSQGSLYIDGQKVIESNSGTIVVQADPGQSLTTKVSGAGVMTLESDTTVTVAATLQMASGKRITDQGGNAVVFGDKVDLDNNQLINVGSPTADGHAVTKLYVDQLVGAISTDAITEGDTEIEIADLGTGTVGITVDGSQRLALSGTAAAFTVPVTVNGIELADLNELSAAQSAAEATAAADATAKANAAQSSAVAYTDTREAAITSAYAAADSALQSNIDTEKSRIDAIMSASTSDADTFAEIVSLVNSVDTTNDSALGTEIANRTSADTALSGRLDTVEGSGAGSIAKAQADAQSYADTAESDAITTSNAYTDTREAAAAADATSKANAAQTAAVASAEAKDAVRATAAAADATAKADAAQTAAEATASADATAKANAAQSAAQTYADTAEADAVATAAAYTDSRETAITTAYEAYSDVQKGRIDAILSASSADKDTFAEIVTFVNSVDTTNDTALGTEIATRAAADTALSGRLNTVEGSGAGSIAKAQADAIASAEAKDAVRATAAAADATSKANAARSAAEATASADATAKANAAQSAAIAASASALNDFHSAVQDVTSSATVAYTFSELVGAKFYQVFLNRQLIRPSELASVNLSTGVVTFEAAVVASGDEVEVNGFKA